MGEVDTIAIESPKPGERIILFNESSQHGITFTQDDNIDCLVPSETFVLLPRQSVEMFYNSTVNRWTVMDDGFDRWITFSSIGWANNWQSGSEGAKFKIDGG